ncbi:MAG TPA: tetratricopeptide repeat protein [Acetobacteraceae bacterium]
MPNSLPTILVISALAATLPLGALSGRPAEAATPDSSGLYADYLAARFAQAQDDPTMAAEYYLRALERNPTQPDLLRHAFMASALSGRVEAAGLARLLPGDTLAQLWLVGAAAKAGDWGSVERRANALAVDKLSDDPLAGILSPLLLAWAEQAQGRTDAALAVLRPLAEDSRFRALFALHEGLIADLAGQEARATAAMAKARDVDGAPGLRLAQILASFDARHGRQAAGLQELAQAGAAAPEIGLVLPALSRAMALPPVGDARDGIAEAFLAAAGSLQTQNDDRRAAVLLDIVLALRPDLTAGRLLGAEIDEAAGRKNAARLTLEAIAPTDPLAPLARLRDAGLMAEAGDTDAALAAFDALARDCPQSALPLIREAETLRAKGQFDEAIAAYDQAMARETKPNWTLFYERGVARDQAHDRAGGEADMQKALDLSPDQPLVLNYLGYSWAEKGEHLGEARRMIEAAVQAKPNDGAIVDSLGYVMLRQGDIAGAVRTLEHATELMPDDATVNGHLGDAYAAAGRRLEAGYEWRRALMLNPEPEEAEQLKAKLVPPPRQSALAAPAAR